MGTFYRILCLSVWLVTLAVWFVADFEALSYQATLNFNKS